MLGSFSIYLSEFISLLVIVPILIGIKKYSYLTKIYKILLLFLFVSATSDLIMVSLAHRSINNHFVIRIYTIAEFLIFSWFYRTVFSDRPIIGKAIWIATFVFLVFCLITSLFLQSWSDLDSYNSSLEALLLIIMSLILIFKNSQSIELQSWGSNAINWFNTGILIYFSGLLFFFSFSNYLLQLPRETALILWKIQDTLGFVLYTFFIIGFTRYKRVR